ncbi:magnesium/cobalt transporter CorA [Leeia sp.]|uniref:magnesium/cobalt transporter CorA n=1 Tax=Leeia sp. TaxID=2884678 RepID=UPI0035AE7639
MKRARPHGRQKKAGLPPGSLVHVGEVKTEPRLDLLCYDEQQLTRHGQLSALDQPGLPSQQWLNVYGLQDTQLLTQIGERYGLHPLVLEDILNTEQRPKLDLYPNCLFLVVHRHGYDSEGELQTEQVSFVLGRGWLLTFQEQPSGQFSGVRERLLSAQPQQRKGGVDYLMYSLVDAVVDQHFALIEKLGDRIEALEDELMGKGSHSGLLAAIYQLKRQASCLRRSLWPLRECLNGLTRDDGDYFLAETQLYLRDVYDHAIHALESLESLRDQMAGILDIHVTVSSHALNQDMRVLTVITTIFMPLTLLSSIYGMNFDHMPELHWRWGYYVLLGVMALVAVGMGLFFWRRRWL